MPITRHNINFILQQVTLNVEKSNQLQIEVHILISPKALKLHKENNKQLYIQTC